MIPIFSRSWFRKITEQLDLEIAAVSFRSACDMSRHRVDDDHIDGVRTHQHLDDLERLLASIGLADEQVVDLHPDTRRVDRVERVLCVDERRHAALLLSLGDDVQRERRLAGRLRSVQLRDPTARDAPHSERQVEQQRASRDDCDLSHCRLLAELHDRALAVALRDLRDRGVECLFLLQSRCLLGRCGECSMSKGGTQSLLYKTWPSAHGIEQLFGVSRGVPTNSRWWGAEFVGCSSTLYRALVRGYRTSRLGQHLERLDR